jgi:hypothetical protein
MKKKTVWFIGTAVIVLAVLVIFGLNLGGETAGDGATP